MIRRFMTLFLLSSVLLLQEALKRTIKTISSDFGGMFNCLGHCARRFWNEDVSDMSSSYGGGKDAMLMLR